MNKPDEDRRKAEETLLASFHTEALKLAASGHDALARLAGLHQLIEGQITKEREKAATLGGKYKR